jgi:serine/threonine protein kinase
MEMPAGEDGDRRLAPGTKLGRYEIVDLLGVGGMGEVYLARDEQLDRKVAIKFLNSKYQRDEANVRRFVQEAKAASGLNHPNILTVYEIGCADTSHYIVSEFVDGHLLRRILERETLQLSQVLDICIQVAGALSAAHAARIVHRDIKPENIVIRNDGYAKVLDFGLAKLLPERASLVGLEEPTVPQHQTEKGLILGTVRYMSPEQAKGETVDARTDIFSLGVLLYEMVTGRTPFSAPSTPETLANLITLEPAPMSRYVSVVPEDLQRIVAKMVRKDPDERYQTMKGLIADLKELKERVAIGSKLPQLSEAESERQTEHFQLTTRDIANTTGDPTSPKLSRIWPRLLWAMLPVLLIGIAGSFYWTRPIPQPQGQIKSLAVLPLRSLDPTENYLGLGIADALIRRISQTGALTVRPTSAVRRYLNEETDALTAGRQLAADAVLEGSVQRANDRLRISVNLLRTDDGTSLWADSFDMRDADIFAIQDSVAQQVASRLKLHLDPDQQANLGKHITNNPLAYEYYVRGVYSFDLRGLQEKAKPQAEATADLFKKAIEADPNFGLAHAQLAYVYAWLSVLIDPSDDVSRERAEEEISIASKLDPGIAESHIARGILLSSAHNGYQTDAAIREYLEAERLNPNAAHGNLADLYYHVGLGDLAERELRVALEIDPTSIWTKTEIRYFYNNYRKYDELEAAFKNFFPGEPIWSSYYIGKGRLDEAQSVLDKEMAEGPDDPYVLSDKAKLLALKGNNRDAATLLPQILKGADRRNLTYHHLMYEVACNYALLGNSGDAVKFLKEAAATGYAPYELYTQDPFLEPVRRSPEFVQFMTEMKPLYEARKKEFE